MFTPSQIKTTLRPNNFTAQDAGIYSNADFGQFWKRIFSLQHSDSIVDTSIILQCRHFTVFYTSITR